MTIQRGHHLVLLAAFAASLSACSTLPGARPLEPGEHEVGLTFGGPLFSNLGAPIPMPMANLEARHGLTLLADRPLDLNYGLNLTPLAFGVAQAHVGASYLLARPNGWVPAVAVTNRLYLGSNFLDPEPESDVPVGFWAMDQIEFAVSWDAGDHFLIWLSLAEYLDLGSPSLLLAPALGFSVDPGADGGIRFGLEGRWYGLNRRPEVDIVKWVPGPTPIGVSLGVSYAF